MNEIQHSFDRHALGVARGIASIDRERIAGSRDEYIELIQKAIFQAMVVAFQARATLPDEMIEALALHEADERAFRMICEPLSAGMERLIRTALKAVNGELQHDDANEVTP